MRKILRGGICIQLSLLLLLCSCGNGNEGKPAEDIVLLEPVGAIAGYEPAAYRNLYDVKTYASAVYPQITEYAYETDQIFSGYSVLPGEEVKAGELLLKADLNVIDRQIEAKRETLREMEESHAEYVTDMQTQIDAAAEKTAFWEARLQEQGAEGEYKLALHNENDLRQQLDNANQLYELDHAYEAELLAELLEEREAAFLYSEASGVVVATAYLNAGSYIEAGRPVAAVADLEQKVLKCEFIKAYVMDNTKEVYAFIDGKRYEIEYQPMKTGEYNRLTEQGGSLFSTFHFLDDTSDLEIGSYAVIVLVSDSRKEVVTVSKEAIRRDENGSYVYVYRDGEMIYTPIKTGMTDGSYTEIVSGLSVGEMVMVQKLQQYGSNTTVLEKDNYADVFGGRGNLYYPSSVLVRNEIEYGTVYFQEFLVGVNQHVEKGDVIATVRVEGDEAALDRIKSQLARAEERLEDYKKQWEEAASVGESSVAGREDYEQEVLRRTERISELRTQMDEMERNFSTTRIVASESGIVTWTADYEKEDILRADSSLLGIADESFCFIRVEQQSGARLNYGDIVEISYLDIEDPSTTQGTVVSIANAGLSGRLQSNIALILVKQPLTGMTDSMQHRDGRYSLHVFRVSGSVQEIKDVVLVPRSAVKERNGRLYVDVVTENGDIVETSFIAGGFDMNNYWVIDGLEEGMKVCCE